MNRAKRGIFALVVLLLLGIGAPVRAQEQPAGGITLHIELQPGAPEVRFPDEQQLFAAILTNDDRENAQNGHQVKVFVTVRPTKEPWDADVIERGRQDYDLEMYLDISVHKELAGLRTQVTRLNAPIGMRVQIPEHMRGYPEYALIRSHQGRGEILPRLEDSVEEIVVESSEFSTYGILRKGQKRFPEKNTDLGLTLLIGIGALATLIGVFAIWKRTRVGGA